MLTFARVVKVQAGNRNVTINGVKRVEPWYVYKTKLTIPKPPETGPMKTFSVRWTLVPLFYGVYCIVGGERDRRRSAKTQHSQT